MTSHSTLPDPYLGFYTTPPRRMIINPYAFPVAAGSSHVITAQTPGALTTPGAYGGGFRHTVGTAAITVTDVGAYKIPGSAGTGTAYLFDDSFNILTGSTVSIDQTLSASADGYIYVTLGTPIVLSASTAYRCMYLPAAANQLYDDTTTITATADITVTHSCYVIPGTPASGANNTAGSKSYGPVNFKYHL